MLSLKLLWRNWRSGELRLLAMAILLAVAVVSAINIFTQRLEVALIAQSNTFLGADRIVRSSHPATPEQYAQATTAGIRQARTVQFSSMTFAGERMHLASVKAVSETYPLLGRVELSEQAFSKNPAQLEQVVGAPKPGTAWVDSRILPLLDIEIGDSIGVGEIDLKVSKVIVREPDRGDSFSLFGARVMINLKDLAATEVVQPGSRIQYNWLLAAPDEPLQKFLNELSLSDHQKVIDLQAAQRGLSRTLGTGRQFLSLAGMIGVLLAGVAIAIAAQQFARRHTDQVALLKSLGASAWKVRALYASQLFIIAALASLVGVLAGELIQRLISSAVSAIYPLELATAPLSAYFIGVLTGMVCLVFFALPPLWYLPTVSPLKVLRRELSANNVSRWMQGLLGCSAVFFLVWIYSQDIKLTASILVAFLCLAMVAGLLALVLLQLGRRLGMKAGSSWRLAWSNLQRYRAQSVMQILVFATAIMLLIVITVVRTSLIDEWKFSLPEDAPNHFFVNISTAELDSVEAILKQRQISHNGLYPMVRGRIVKVNQQPPTVQQKSNNSIFRRESNLSWSQALPLKNEITSGLWWDKWQSAEAGMAGVSVERELADELGLKLGDKLGFSIGGLALEAEIASFRNLNWDTMQPNFYFLFSPGTLQSFSPSYMTSVYIPAQEKRILNTLLRNHPTMLVIEMDLVIEQIQKLTQQVSDGVELVLALVLLGGIMVLLAAVNASMDYRMQEAGILRALGSTAKRILGSTFLEFFMLGILAGLIAVLGAEVLLMGLQHWVLKLPLQPHYWSWVLGPLFGGVLVASLGLWASRAAVSVPPAVVLREL